jgi:hypothetical protein
MTTRCGQLQALGLAIVLAIGAGVAWAVLVGIGIAIVNSVLPAPHRVDEDVLILRDGTPLIQSVVDNDYQNPTFRTLSGKRIRVERIDGPPGTSLRGPEKRTHRDVSVPWEQRVLSVAQTESHEDRAAWYFWHDGQFHGHGYLVGYDIRSKQRIGYLGRKGFRPDEPPLEEQFPVAGRKLSRFWEILVAYNPGGPDFENLEPLGFDAFDCRWLVADDGLVRINLKERSVDMVRKEDGLISAQTFVDKLKSAKTSSTKARSVATIVVRTPDRVLVLDLSNGKELGTYPLPEKFRHADIRWLQISPDKVLITAYRGEDLFWFDATGKMVRHDRVSLQKPPRRTSKIVEDIEIAMDVPSPATIAGGFAYYLWSEPERPESMDYSEALIKALRTAWLIFAITGAISIILACLCYLRQRKYGLPWTAVWVVLVLLFGLPAYLGYLAHRGWPARLPCPNCGRAAPRDRDACFACGQQFPSPAPKGIEVFA